MKIAITGIIGSGKTYKIDNYPDSSFIRITENIKKFEPTLEKAYISRSK